MGTHQPIVYPLAQFVRFEKKSQHYYYYYFIIVSFFYSLLRVFSLFFPSRRIGEAKLPRGKEENIKGPLGVGGAKSQEANIFSPFFIFLFSNFLKEENNLKA
jgi:hypothetical protein